MKLSDHMNVFTIRKKIVLASKLMGAILVLSYVFSTRLPLNADASLMLWLIFVAVLICMIDLWMARFISKPVSELNEAAGRMADLDFSHLCEVTGHDEFGQLSHSLNVMARNLQKAFEKLEYVNSKLKQDVEQENACWLSGKNLLQPFP